MWCGDRALPEGTHDAGTGPFPGGCSVGTRLSPRVCGAGTRLLHKEGTVLVHSCSPSEVRAEERTAAWELSMRHLGLSCFPALLLRGR